MTNVLESPTLARAKGTPAPLRLVSAEIMKIRTTNTWWLFAIGMVAITGLAFTSNAFQHHFVGMSYFDSGANSPDGTWALDGERLTAYSQLLRDSDTAWYGG